MALHPSHPVFRGCAAILAARGEKSEHQEENPMGVAKSEFGFPDCREFLNNAKDSEKGWSVTFKERGDAVAFRMRCYTVRRRELERNKKFYEEGEVMHDRTIWDGIVFIIKEVEGGWNLLAMHDGPAALEAQVVRQGPIE